ncbi:hypothetical protein [Actinacidiphila paucisporea]|uniref:Secreted protein n=1 Tax=Actinacidiphila paucisporea TaxID=310782 RepID=A0A1M7FWL7_9ACTN|nr:hypothetical protein [Actinacidiphila paucisporea]SHM08396.1 hypothetical protein SAMN05216499_10876 [Actinacidiphila paucisporea]
MISRTLKRAAAAAGTSVLVVMAGGGATAGAQTTVQPQAVQGSVIRGGADGTPRTLMCPPEENVLSGGFALSAPQGRALGRGPADLLESRPTPDATGWVITVRKDLAPADRGRPGTLGAPADLTLFVVCTQGENTPGG